MQTTTLAPPPGRRWLQLLLGLIVMMSISSPQYVWTFFTKPLAEATGATLPAIQVTASILVILQTWLSPGQGWLIDRFGPRFLITLGAALSGLGWILASQISSLYGLYATYGLFCGVGTGFVYIGVVGLMVRWFPERRGFAVGVVAAGYGFGALLTTFPIDSMMKAEGFRPTLLTFGIILGVVGVLAALCLRVPHAGDVVNAAELRTGATPKEMLRSPIFWLMFLMMTMMSTGGLMIVFNFASFARDFGIAGAVVFGTAALPLALSIDRITNGLTRPFFGWVSDRIGRENTMALAFGLEAVAIAALLYFRHDATIFVLLSGVVFFGWGEIFSLFPSTLTDTFGERYATTNYGFLYMAQGIGSILGGPLAAMLKGWTGSWEPVFFVIIGLDLVTALLAFFVLKGMRARRGNFAHAEPLGAPAYS
ncbi:oxalate/formate MFS antiporter [Beijerinckia sp. L45]|uniref:oxalate/formate MFS antiporter n=1 Tax=Beijerinckia sp. L45 TaxID=1641855 RepID=UPI00131D6860|nr:oxalate/formate MFS antiporter [Beijerinckia sp. L45]